jgi:hypothetical protein
MLEKKIKDVLTNNLISVGKKSGGDLGETIYEFVDGYYIFKYIVSSIFSEPVFLIIKNDTVIYSSGELSNFANSVFSKKADISKAFNNLSLLFDYPITNSIKINNFDYTTEDDIEKITKTYIN